MQRRIVYQGQIPLDADLLWGERNLKTALGQALNLLYGDFSTVSAAFGFSVTPSASALTIAVGSGVVASSGAIDETAFGGNGGGISADTSAQFVVYGCAGGSITLTAGQTATLYAVCSEADTDETVLPFYNADNPSQTQAGPGNAGTSLPVTRLAQAELVLAAEAPASPSGGAIVPLYTVTVPAGATTAAGATTKALTAFYPTVPQLERGRYLGTQKFTSSGIYTPSNRARMARVRMCGAGGPGGYAQANDSDHNSAGGSGGAAGEIEFWFDVSDGAIQSITIGASAESTNTNTQNKSGSTWLGSIVECQGGVEGSYGFSTSTSSVSVGGQAEGGAVTVYDASKILSVIYQKQGQDGAGGWYVNGITYPGIGTQSFFGGGTYATSNGAAQDASGYGGGAGGGGSTTSTGYPGGLGSPGVVIIEEYA
ncbi:MULTISPECIES: hypothetical protein [unclassified Acetobacter]|uniref:hypothetical protein n=1 Tax=unclassified Acetobacter TaxID=2628570 RepID=UPI00123828BF|nr:MULTISPECIES: hypothetical protein [unclassified Acetobacter]KAA8397134.1 hypothetical protein FKW22_05025 [Acetobacter sp. DmW_125124]KAA8397681.1 hypothetical protein FKW20_08460 [Acetobacter sp. DmW_125127]KAA8401082.1 hypothetical protein FKW19_00265 [Acetobacter sp. DmW_125128]KAA8404935.1 hypothetical protein FKW32_07625 [Acetobacter sp. DmW_125132]KAA8405448.1 hypothetical protein FKW15_06940 [Acetobacter sp. DmW_125133]